MRVTAKENWYYTTAYNRWRKAGVCDRLMDAFSKGHDGNVQLIDSSIARVHQHASGVKKEWTSFALRWIENPVKKAHRHRSEELRTNLTNRNRRPLSLHFVPVLKYRTSGSGDNSLFEADAPQQKSAQRLISGLSGGHVD